MRRMTDEEAQWLKKFDRSYNAKRCQQKRYRHDTMNQKWVSSIDETSNLESLINSTATTKPDLQAQICLRPSSRGLGPNGPSYSPRDYWALPSQWYSHGWVDFLIRIIDAEKGEVEETDIPGIIIENGKFKVFSFHNNEKVSVGEYITLSRAEAALINYNNTVTQRGYGVDE